MVEHGTHKPAVGSSILPPATILYDGIKVTILEQFESHLRTTQLIKPKQKIFVACSGGPDSVALFHLLYALKDKFALKLGLFHVNHDLRGKASAADALFVKDLGKRMDVPAYLLKRKVTVHSKLAKASLEEAAREVRYTALAELAKKHGIRRIVTAHTQNDQAETVLMRVIQGTGLRGLSGVRSTLKRGSLHYIRPLLPFQKEQLVDYLKENKLKSRRDHSNSSRRFLRNRIRLDLIPLLHKEFNPKIVAALARLSSIAGEENQLIDQLEDEAWNCVRSYQGKSACYLNRHAFLKLSPAVQYKVLDRALKAVHPRSGLSYEAWSRLRALLGQKTYRCHLPRGVEFALTPTRIEVTIKKSAK